MGMPEDFGDWGDEAFLGFCAEDWRDLAPRGAEALDSQMDATFEDRYQMDELDLEWDYNPDEGDDIGQELDMADPEYTLEDDDLQEWCNPELSEGYEGGEYGECTWED